MPVSRELLEAPRLPVTRRRVDRTVTSLIVLLVVCAIMGVVSLAVVVSNKKPVHQTPNGYVAVASLAAWDYLLGRPATGLPLASGVGQYLGRLPPGEPSSQQVQPFPVKSVTFAGTQAAAIPDGHQTEQVVVDSFYVVADGMKPFDLSVTLAVPPGSSTPIVAAPDSVGPITLSGAQGSSVSYGTSIQGQVSQALTSQIDTWAQAFAANNESTLYNITGDSAQHHYVGIGGWTVTQQPTVLSGVVAKQYELIQVQFTVSLDSNPAVSATMDYDLLVANLKSAFPNIVAWGPTGSGYNLSPYQNALPGLYVPPTSTTPPNTASSGTASSGTASSGTASSPPLGG